MPMPSRLLTLLFIPLVALVAACGSESAQPASARSDASQLLRDTFANLAKLRSADVQLRLASPSGHGRVTTLLSGPFASTGDGKLPRFALRATLRAAGRTERFGATWTGEKAFITLRNTPYAVSDLVARQFVAGYEQALRTDRAQGGPLLPGLGVDFTKWLEHPRNAGTAQVGDAPAVEITGRADVPRMVGDLGRISQRARALAVPWLSGAPAQPTAAQRRRLAAAVRSVAVEVYTGAQDRILRRLVVHARLREPRAGSRLDLDLRFTRVNADQRIAAPANPKPFGALLKVTGALDRGGLGALLRSG